MLQKLLKNQVSQKQMVYQLLKQLNPKWILKKLPKKQLSQKQKFKKLHKNKVSKKQKVYNLLEQLNPTKMFKKLLKKQLRVKMKQLTKLLEKQQCSQIKNPDQLKQLIKKSLKISQ
jgi:ubiquinone biosynthesis protein Coq4